MKLNRLWPAVNWLVVACLLLSWPPSVWAQNENGVGESGESAEARKERIAAERFLELLKQRPRSGTALDRVYGYHVGRGTLDEFCKSLETDAGQNNDGRLWMILGMVQMQRGDDTGAAASLRKAAELLPEEPLASYYLGKTLVLLGDVENAVVAMRTAIERKPARADMLAIFQDLGRLFQRTGRNDEALTVWQQLETQFPNDSQVQEEIARILAEEGALAPAIERYAALSKSSPDRFRQVEMAIRGAQLKAQLGKNDEALKDFEAQLAKVNPDSWLHRDIRRRIEEVFWSSGDIDGLVAYYTGWVEKHPEDVDAMMRTARFLAVQRRLPEAETWFRKAIEKSPSTTEPRMALVEALVADEEYGKAAKEMKELVALEPDNPDNIVRWGELVLNDSGHNPAERKSEAAEIWKRLLEKRGDDPVMVARVADLLRSSESSDEALAQYRRAIELAPNEPQYREYLGEYLHQLGRKDEAIAVWQELASGERQTRDNLVRLSEVFSTFGYDDKALTTMAAACDEKPTFGHRARYAELLREAGKFDESLAQLTLAEPLADDPELRQIVIDERIKNYQARGTLAEQIEQLEADVNGDKAGDAETWRFLALLREADRQFQPACEAAEKATSLDPGNAAMWEAAAMLQERSGRFGDAIESYRKLATIDRRFLTNYLTQIASLEMRVGNTESALKVGEELIAAAPDNAEHYRFFADVCFRVGEEERGFEVLRRSVRSNPNDSEALLYLARVLSEAFRTDEAIELYWRGFDLAKDLDGKIAVITPLTELYLRTNRFETFTDRLEATGREQNKPRDGLLWVAAANQAAGDLGTAKRMLEQLVREESRDTKLLEQMVALSRAEYDFESAAEYQRRLVAISPTPEAEYQLANILLELGEIEQSEALWLKIAQRKNNSTSLTDAITTLVGKEQYDTAAAIIDKSLASDAENWEVLTQAMLVYAKLDRGEDARRVAQRVLELNVDASEPTQKTKEAIARRASRRNADPIGYDPYAELGRPSQQMQTVHRLKAMMSGSRDMYYGGSRQPIAPSCFADARAIALCMPLVAKDEVTKESEFVKERVEKALAGGDEEQLWTAIFYMVWQNPSVQHGQTKDAQFEACLKSLVDREDSDAAGLMLQSFVNRQRRSPNGSSAAQKPLTEDELKELRKLSELAGRSSGGTASYHQLWVATELARAGKEEEAESIIDTYIESAKQSANKYASLQAISVLLGDGSKKDVAPRMLARCRDLFKSSLATATMTTTSQGGYGSVYERLMVELVEGDQLESALASVDDLLRWQAQQTADLRPSQRERMGQASGPIAYYRLVNGRHEQVTIAFPPPSSYFGAESIYMLYGLHEACKADPKRLAQAKSQIDQWAAEPGDDPYLRLARIMAKACFAYWSEDRDEVMDTLAQAADLQVGGQFVNLARARLLNETGKYREALAVVEQLEPSNQTMLVERELAVLQLVLQLGDLERARQSAQKLFALRLDSDTEFKLADLMYQLGMRELGDRIMGRIGRRAGGNQQTLVQLMTRYVGANKNDEAAEIARQVIRRTEPRLSNNYITSENQQHEQAVRILVQTEQLEPLIKQYEELVERSPKSIKLVNKLAGFYEATGRREDSLKLRMKAADAAPNDPQSLLAAARQLSGINKHEEAVEKYIAAVIASPDMLENEYYNLRTSFDQAKAWDRLADAVIEAGIGKFGQSYRMSEIIEELAEDKQFDAVNRLLYAGLSELSLQQLSYMFYSVARRDFEIDQKIVDLLSEKLESDEFMNDTGSNYVHSRSSGGQSTGFADGVAHIVAQSDELQEHAVKTMKKRLAENEELLFPRVLLALVLVQAEKFDEVREVLKPLMEKEPKTLQHGEALWCVASELTYEAKQPALACELLESIKDPAVMNRGGSQFQFSSTALLAEAYQRANKHSEARRILLKEMESMTVDTQQNQYNPGYGDYQYIESQSELARKFLAMNYPAEAFIAFRKAYADKDRIARAGRWGGNAERQRESVKKQIADQTSAEAVIKIIDAAMNPAADGDTANDMADVAKYLTSPEIDRQSMIDVRVTMPFVELTHMIADDDKLKQELAKWLAESPLQGDAKEQTLKSLVTRLLISDAVDSDEEIAATSAAVVAWFQAHESEGPAATAGKPANDDSASKGQAQPLPDDLLLCIAATRMPKDADNAIVVRMLERSLAAGKASDQLDLARGLKSELARRVASSDPEAARKGFIEVLDDLLPADDTTNDRSAE